MIMQEPNNSVNASTQTHVGGSHPVTFRESSVAFDIDTREQLFNQREVGPIYEVSLPEFRVVDLDGILIDLEARILKTGALIPLLPPDPHSFYNGVVKQWLDRHPVLRRAEVRCSGQGLHVIVRPETTIRLNNGSDRQRWKGIINLIQSAIPSDPRAPKLNAVTRPIGSVNSKSQTQVILLATGEPVPVAEIIGLASEMRDRFFSTVVKLLYGRDQVTPCPCCGNAKNSMKALDRVGVCYKCGKIRLSKIMKSVYAPTVEGGE